MDRMNIAILDISELRWPDSGDVNTENHKVLYSGLTNGIHEHKMSIILADEMARSMKNFIPILSRIILIQLSATPVYVNIIHVYTPTTGKEVYEVEEFYHNIKWSYE